MADPKHQVVTSTYFQNTLRRAFSCGDYIAYDDSPALGYPPPNKHYDRITEDTDPFTGKPTLRVSVSQIIAQFLGGGWEIHVEQEFWGGEDMQFMSMPAPHKHSQLAIHLRKVEDNNDFEIITLREYMGDFPSDQLRAKLELLKYK